MSADVISHQPQHRKQAQSWTGHRIAVLIVAAVAVVAASWMAQSVNRPAETATPAAPEVAQPILPTAPSAHQSNIDTAPSAQISTPPARARSHRTGVPLDGVARAEPPGYEILSAAELDGISQARD